MQTVVFMFICTMYILYNVCAMNLTFLRLGVIFLTFMRQECHVKIKAKCHNCFVKVSQITRVPQVEKHCYTAPHYVT